MKTKLLIMGVLCAVAFTANAQTEKGKNLIGGNLNFFTGSAEQDVNKMKQNEFSIGPNYGHFIRKNLALGIRLNYTHSNVENEFLTGNSTLTVNTVVQNNYNIGPFVRYYVDISEKFKFFGQFNANVGFGEYKQTNGTSTKTKTTSYGANVIPSFAIFPTKKIAIELGFGLISYNKSTSENEPSDFTKSKSEGFSFGFDSINPSLGVNFHF